MTPLACASQEGCYDAVRLLVSRKDVDPLSIDNLGRTPCILALSGKSPKATVHAFPREIQIWNPQDPAGRTPLSCAVRTLDWEKVKKLLTCPETDMTIKDFEGHDPLYWCWNSPSDKASIDIRKENRQHLDRTRSRLQWRLRIKHKVVC